MRIRKKQSMGMIVYFITLLVFNYLAYIKELSYDRINVITLVLLLGILFTGAYNEMVRNVEENRIILLFFLVYLVQVLFSSINYSQSLAASFFSEKYYFILLLYYVLVRCFSSENDKEIVIDAYIILSFVIGTLIDIQTLLLHDKGIEILLLEYGKRAGGIRVLNSAHFIEIGILLSVSKIINYWEDTTFIKRIIYVGAILSGLIDVFFVSQTRMSIFIIVAIMGFAILMKDFGYSRQAMIKRIAILMIILLVVGLILNSSVVSALIDDFGNNTVSVSLRLSELRLYLGQLFESPINFVFGLGMIHDTNTSYLYSVLGVNGTGGRTDVGVIGFINEFGVLGLVIYLWIMVRGYRLIKQSRKSFIKCHDLLVLYSYYILGSGTLFMFNRGRIFAVPIMLYLYRFYSNKIENQYYGDEGLNKW